MKVKVLNGRRGGKLNNGVRLNEGDMKVRKWIAGIQADW